MITKYRFYGFAGQGCGYLVLYKNKFLALRGTKVQEGDITLENARLFSHSLSSLINLDKFLPTKKYIVVGYPLSEDFNSSRVVKFKANTMSLIASYIENSIKTGFLSVYVVRDLYTGTDYLKSGVSDKVISRNTFSPLGREKSNNVSKENVFHTYYYSPNTDDGKGELLRDDYSLILLEAKETLDKIKPDFDFDYEIVEELSEEDLEELEGLPPYMKWKRSMEARERSQEDTDLEVNKLHELEKAIKKQLGVDLRGLYPNSSNLSILLDYKVETKQSESPNLSNVVKIQESDGGILSLIRHIMRSDYISKREHAIIGNSNKLKALFRRPNLAKSNLRVTQPVIKNINVDNYLYYNILDIVDNREPEKYNTLKILTDISSGTYTDNVLLFQGNILYKTAYREFILSSYTLFDISILKTEDAFSRYFNLDSAINSLSRNSGCITTKDVTARLLEYVVDGVDNVVIKALLNLNLYIGLISNNEGLYLCISSSIGLDALEKVGGYDVYRGNFNRTNVTKYVKEWRARIKRDYGNSVFAFKKAQMDLLDNDKFKEEYFDMLKPIPGYTHLLYLNYYPELDAIKIGRTENYSNDIIKLEPVNRAMTNIESIKVTLSFWVTPSVQDKNVTNYILHCVKDIVKDYIYDNFDIHFYPQLGEDFYSVDKLSSLSMLVMATTEYLKTLTISQILEIRGIAGAEKFANSISVRDGNYLRDGERFMSTIRSLMYGE